MKKVLIFVFVCSFLYSLPCTSAALIDDFYYSGSSIQIKEVHYNVTLSSDYSKVFIDYLYGSAIFDFGDCTIENHLEFCVEEYELLNDEENIRKLELKVNEEECVSKKILGNNTGECLLRLGASCTNNTDCMSNHCVHDVCTPTNPFCGDNKCDINETCYSDCHDKKETEEEEQDEIIESTTEEENDENASIDQDETATSATQEGEAESTESNESTTPTIEQPTTIEYVKDTSTSQPYMLWVLFGIGIALITINTTKFYTIFRYGK